MELIRGRVYLANLGAENADPKYWIVVSSNLRNNAFKDALAIRVTTTDKYADLPSVEKLPDGECIHGYVRADTLTTIYGDEPTKSVGGLSVTAMKRVESALRGALDL